MYVHFHHRRQILKHCSLSVNLRISKKTAVNLLEVHSLYISYPFPTQTTRGILFLLPSDPQTVQWPGLIRLHANLRLFTDRTQVEVV